MSHTALTDKIAALRDAGAPAFDASSWQHILSLRERMQAHHGAVRTLLDHKLLQALDALQTRMAAVSASRVTLATEAASSSTPLPSVLGQLVQAWQVKGQTHQPVQPTPIQHPQQESPRVQAFRAELGKLRTHKQVNHALAQAPLNAGPLNSHMLVLKSMGLMREASPDYVQHLVMYVETLQRLATAGEVKARKAVPTQGKTTRKTTPKRTSARKAEVQMPK